MARVSREVADQVRARDCHRCQRCNVEGKNTLHHVIRSSNGGSDEEDNLCLLCVACHSLTERLYDKGVVTPATFWQWLDKEWHDATKTKT